MSRRDPGLTPLALLAVLGALAGCAPQREQRVQLYAMNTLVEVSVMRGDAAAARTDFAAVEYELRRVEQIFRAWDDGALAEANRALTRDGRATVVPELAAALADARTLSAASAGRFDPGVGRLVELWGFNVEDRSAGPPPPDARLRDAISTLPRIARLMIGREQLSAAPVAPWLDLGGYAKGLAVDRAVAALRARGVRDALVNAGGDVRAIGRRGGRPWRIGLRDPRQPRIHAEIEIAGDSCIFTSGDYERAFVWDGVTYHHIIDPETGAPGRGAASATVVIDGGSCARADAAATALVVGGPAALTTLVHAMTLDGAAVVTADGVLHATAALRARLHTTPDLRVVVVTP